MDHFEANHMEMVRDNLEAELERFKAALTPSADTKAAYIGEFSVSLPDLDENGIEYTRKINVPWTTIKEIMASILAKAEGKP